MRTLLDIVKHRLLSFVIWMVCSLVFEILGCLGGAGIGYLSEAMGWVEYPEAMFSRLTFLLFPFAGGIVGLIAMHVVRVMGWIKMHHSYMEAHEGWTRKYSMRIVIIDEIAWLIAFVGLHLLIVSIM